MMRRLFSIVLIVAVVGAKAQKVPAATGSKVTQQDAQASLDFHNKVRKDVGTAPLEWSASLASFAQAWADKLATDGCKIKHRPTSGTWAQQHGENIYYATGREINTFTASKAWYSEIKDFSYGKLNINNLSKTGHYTQMVWHATKSLGIGSATCPSGAVIVVANYNPLGNYIGEKPY